MKLIKALILMAAVCAYGSATSDLEEFIVKKGGKITEGHVCGRRSKMPQFFANLLSDNPQVKSIVEIGFNAGHSSVLFLAQRKDIHVTSFDIATHPYLKFGKMFVDKCYPKRHCLIKGSSLETVPQFHRDFPEETFDLIFIDGCHKYEFALQDIINMRDLAHPGTLVVIDDVNKPGRNAHKAWRECVLEGIITEGKIFRSNGKAWVLCEYR